MTDPSRPSLLERLSLLMLREPGETISLKGGLAGVLRKLARLGITSVLVEGGAAVHGEFLRAGLWDELRLFIAPRLFGADALSWAGFRGAPIDVQVRDVARVGPDLLLTLRPGGSRSRSTSRARSRARSGSRHRSGA